MWSTFKILKRHQWEAREPRFKKKLNLPVSKIIIHKSNSKQCWETDECLYKIKKLQKFHMVKDNLSDIKYNFIVGGNNQVFEGRGWELQGEHTPGLDDQSIGIAFLMKYADRPPDKEELQAVKDLILDGLKKGYISKGFKIIAHEELSDETICPGFCLLEDLMTFNKDLNKNFGVK